MTAGTRVDPQTGPPSPRTPLDRIAKALTDFLQPTVVLAAGSIAVTSSTATTHTQGLVSGTIAVLLGSILPMIFIVIGVRRGRLSDHHIRVRAQRHVPLLVATTCVAAGMILLIALDSPRPLVVLFGLVIAVLVPSMAVTLWWQISVHAAIAAVISVFLIALWGPWLAVTGIAVAALGWSRVALRVHTTAQVLCGAAWGAAVGACAWPVLG